MSTQRNVATNDTDIPVHVPELSSAFASSLAVQVTGGSAPSVGVATGGLAAGGPTSLAGHVTGPHGDPSVDDGGVTVVGTGAGSASGAGLTMVGAATGAVGTAMGAVGAGTGAVGAGTGAVGAGTGAFGAGTGAVGAGTGAIGMGTDTVGAGTGAVGAGTGAVGAGTGAVGAGTGAVGGVPSSVHSGPHVPRMTNVTETPSPTPPPVKVMQSTCVSPSGTTGKPSVRPGAEYRYDGEMLMSSRSQISRGEAASHVGDVQAVSEKRMRPCASHVAR